MNQRTNLKLLQDASYFSTQTLQQVVRVSDNALYRNIKRWLKSGELIQLKRGLFTTGEYYQKHLANQFYPEFLANQLKTPSYLSLEYVLQKHGLLSESVYAWTSVTTKRANQYTNALGLYLYSNIKPSLMTGFQVKNQAGYKIYEASVAKALFDYFYLKLMKVSGVDQQLLSSYRLNLDDLTAAQRQEFDGYVQLSNQSKMKEVSLWLQS